MDLVMASTGRSIYLDMNALTQPRVTGIGKYCIELFHALQAHTEISGKEYILKPTIKMSRAKHIPKVKSRIGQKPNLLGISDFFDVSEKINLLAWSYYLQIVQVLSTCYPSIFFKKITYRYLD